MEIVFVPPPQFSHFLRRFNKKFVKSIIQYDIDVKTAINYYNFFDIVICTDNIDDLIPQILFKYGIVKEKISLKKMNVSGVKFKKLIFANKQICSELNKKNLIDYSFYDNFKNKKFV